MKIQYCVQIPVENEKGVQSTENEIVYAFILTYLQKTIIIHDCYNACNHPNP